MEWGFASVRHAAEMSVSKVFLCFWSGRAAIKAEVLLISSCLKERSAVQRDAKERTVNKGNILCIAKYIVMQQAMRY